MKNPFGGRIFGREVEEPAANFGAWTLPNDRPEEVTSDPLPWREGELHSAQEMTMTGRELEEDHRFGAWEVEER